MRTERTTVYLVGGDMDLSLSLQFLLESYNCHVEKIELNDPFVLPPSFYKYDIILLDLAGGGPLTFKLLNHLMGALTKPRIMILADTASELRLNDVFAECDIEILLHPVNPKYLVNAIIGIHEAEYQ